jgi:hypothetical protein
MPKSWKYEMKLRAISHCNEIGTIHLGTSILNSNSRCGQSDRHFHSYQIQKSNRKKEEEFHISYACGST